MLTMSDLQLLTGLSILISGYAQLRCGLSAYHWQKIVDLAWFASTTHLCCLTFLRNYLCDRKAERIWRLSAMGVLVLMLIVAIVFTRYFIFEFPSEPPYPGVLRPSPGDYAICYLRHAYVPPVYETLFDYDWQREGVAWRNTLLDTNRQYVIISVILLGFGMLVRILRLQQNTTTWLLQGRRIISRFETAVLEKTYNWANAGQTFSSLKRSLCYRPILALAISLRTLLDLALSMAFEVSYTAPFLSSSILFCLDSKY
jgi:hypothetical protein